MTTTEPRRKSGPVPTLVGRIKVQLVFDAESLAILDALAEQADVNRSEYNRQLLKRQRSKVKGR